MKCFNLTNIEENINDQLFNHLTKIDNVYTASKVDTKEQIQFLKDHGVKLAIDLKNQEETDFNEEAEFKAAGIEYYRFPITDISEIDFETLEKFKELFIKTDENKLVFCMSSNRVGALLALYLAQVCGHPKERALDIGIKAGMKREALQLMVKELLNK